MEDNPPAWSKQTIVIIYYSNFLTFTSTVDLLSQNLLLFVQLLQLSRVQHFAVHLQKITVSINHNRLLLPSLTLRTPSAETLSSPNMLS